MTTACVDSARQTHLPPCHPERRRFRTLHTRCHPERRRAFFWPPESKDPYSNSHPTPPLPNTITSSANKKAGAGCPTHSRFSNEWDLGPATVFLPNRASYLSSRNDAMRRPPITPPKPEGRNYLSPGREPWVRSPISSKPASAGDTPGTHRSPSQNKRREQEALAFLDLINKL